MTLLDVHHHFFSKSTVEAFIRLLGKEFAENFKKFQPERYKIMMELPEPENRARQLIDNMKDNGIDMLLPMAFTFDEEGSFLAHKKYPNQFPGVVPFLDPKYHPDPEIMEDWVKKGAVSIKLYPGQWQNHNLSSPELLPYFKKMAELNLNPIIHFGVMKGGDTSRGWPANPMELRPWLINKDLKNLKFVIAHFGAGYLREIFMIAYTHGKRIFIDTSGSNDWIDWSPWINLTQVFEKSIKALSTSNILFGTDSNIEMLRSDVILRQKGILQDLITRKVITTEDKEKILLKNSLELFSISI
jgi:predicted TIM-barrel fold metal-dependent hydrolase